MDFEQMNYDEAVLILIHAKHLAYAAEGICDIGGALTPVQSSAISQVLASLYALRLMMDRLDVLITEGQQAAYKAADEAREAAKEGTK